MSRGLWVLLAVVLLPACGDGGGGEHEPPPPAPTGLAITGTGAQTISLSWLDSGPDEWGYNIWVRPAGVGAFTLVTSVGTNATSAVAGGLSTNTSYDLQVTAFNARGESVPPSATVTGATVDYAWSQLPDAPVAVQYVQSVHDTLLNRMIVFGGGDDSAAFTDDLYALDLSQTSPTAVSIPVPGLRPGPRVQPSLVYDSRRNSLILFGGILISSGLPADDLWEFDLSPPSLANPDGLTWSSMSPTGAPPVARYGHSAIYDSDNGRMLLFGGSDGAFYLNDVARLLLPTSGAPTWETLTLTGAAPTGRISHSAVFDAPNRRMIVFGGDDNASTGGGPYTNDLWELPLSAATNFTWSLLLSGGSVPAPRQGHMAVYDGVNRQMVVFGGMDEASLLPEDRIWMLALDGAMIWTEPPPLIPTPGARFDGTAVFDPARARLVVWGGTDVTLLAADIGVWALGF